MVSNTKQTARRRRIKQSSVGRANKKARTKGSPTPKFPVHPEQAPAASSGAPKKR